MKFMKLGRFEVSKTLVDEWKNNNCSARLLEGMTILSAEDLVERDAVMYTAVNEMFEPVLYGESIPMYRLVYSSGDQSPKWEIIK